MAFNPSDFTNQGPMTYLDGSTNPSRNQLVYVNSTDTLATIAGAGYFSSVANQIRKGDILLVINASDGSEAMYVDSSNAVTRFI